MNSDPVINGYEIISKIGNGAMGAVYKARQTNLDRIVAVKILSRDPDDEQTDLVGRFQREARVAAGLQHPGIVQVFDAGQAGEKHYFAMEFVEGQSVGDKLKSEEKLSEDETLQIALQRLIEQISDLQAEAWVICGPVFGKNPKSLPSGVFIPDAMFKITVLTSKDRVPHFAAILVTQPDPKTGSPKIMRIGLNRLEKVTGFEFFPDTPTLFSGN